MSPVTHNSRIAKNTILLYVRMLLTMGISLYTSRVILSELGALNYGIYNVVGGLVVMFAFLNSSLTTCTQRFLNYSMGKDSPQRTSQVFSNALTAHLLIAILTAILLECLGPYIILNYLTIPDESLEAAIWVFHSSVAILFIGILTSPFNAAIVAHEKMGIYAQLSIIESILKLGIVYTLILFPYSKLLAYGLLLLIVNIFTQSTYVIYSIRNFDSCNIRLLFEKQVIKQLFSFSGWMITGCISNILSTQGVNMLINIFFNPVYNASRGIAVTVQNAVGNFSSNFMAATRPQIIKRFASGDIIGANRLVFSSSKLSFYLLYLLILPVFIYSDFILGIWLGSPPEGCSFFTQLTLVQLLIESIYAPISQINQASGKVRYYQLSISIIFVLIFLSTLISFYLGAPVYFAYVISIAFSIIGLFVRLWILHIVNKFPALIFIKETLIPFLYVILLTLPFYLIIDYIFGISYTGIIINTTFSTISCIVIIFYIGFNYEEKIFLTTRIKNIYHKFAQ